MQFEEFQVFLGDPRPFLLQYLLTLPGIETYVPNPKKLNPNDVFMFKCMPTETGQKHELKKPLIKLQNEITKRLADKTKPLLAVPIIFSNKGVCRERNLSKHLNILLFNKLTGEVDRIDIKKYHLNKFRMKILLKRGILPLIEHVNNKLAPKDITYKLTPEIDVPIQFIQSFGQDVKVNNIFPIFLLSYLHKRSEKPHETSSSILTMKPDIKNASDIWTAYSKFRLNVESNKCTDNMVINPENGKCISIKGHTFLTNLVEKPLKKCKSEQIFDHLALKCTLKNKLVDIDILLNKLMDIQITADTEFKSLDSEQNALLSINYVLSQYQNARIILPRGLKTEIKRNDFKITWRWNPKLEEFEFKLPEGFWDSWATHMYDPTINFIIVFVGLLSKTNGHHANVLIYDKSKNEMERFDGLGIDIHSAYGISGFDDKIRELFIGKMPTNFKYFVPLDYCPKMPIFQSKEIDEITGSDITGNCAVWRLWYVNTRLANPHLKRKEVIAYASRKLEQVGSLYKYIKGYQLYILQALKNRAAA
jgi:hypothetical protein